MKKMLQFLLCCLALFQVCEAQARNYTFGKTQVKAERLQEKINDYNQCYVDVVVHNSSSFKYGLQNANVTALSLDSGTSFYSEGLTDINGHVCLPVLCRKKIRVFVEKNSVRITALNKTMQHKNIPMGFRVTLEQNNEVINFHSYAWGTVGGRSGPVYSTREKGNCKNATTSDYHFVFSYISVPDRLYSTYPPPLDPNDITNENFTKVWRYGTIDEKRTCFFKIKVKTLSTTVTVKASSRLKDANGILYGVYETGPKYDVNSDDFTNKAACVEFRCPAVDQIYSTEMSTFIAGTIEVPGHPNGCCVSNILSGDIFNVDRTKFSTKSSITSSDNYGAGKGIYMHRNPQTARAKCFTGSEFIGTEYAMNVSIGYAFEYDCLNNQFCNMQIVGK